MQEFEESPDVLVAIAHDMALIDVLPLLNNDPGVDINDWKTQGLKEKARWFWLNELPRDGKPGRKPFLDGRYWNGKKRSSFTDCVKTDRGGCSVSHAVVLTQAMRQSASSKR
jgi:hypothetical protein